MTNGPRYIDKTSKIGLRTFGTLLQIGNGAIRTLGQLGLRTFGALGQMGTGPNISSGSFGALGYIGTELLRWGTGTPNEGIRTNGPSYGAFGARRQDGTTTTSPIN